MGKIACTLMVIRTTFRPPALIATILIPAFKAVVIKNSGENVYLRLVYDVLFNDEYHYFILVIIKQRKTYISKICRKKRKEFFVPKSLQYKVYIREYTLKFLVGRKGMYFYTYIVLYSIETCRNLLVHRTR